MQIGGVSRARCVEFEEFLVLEELNALMQYTLSRESGFRASGVHDPESTQQAHRRSLVSMETGPVHELVSKRIQFYFRFVLSGLNHPYFEISRVESQLTASNDGDYFRLHNDNTHANWPTREITYVYFFHWLPRPFTGGELLLYDSELPSGTAAPRKRIDPECNTMVLFPSSCLHEILTVRCPSRRFADSRFTLNGWLHR